jgi:hypothetical protein
MSVSRKTSLLRDKFFGRALYANNLLDHDIGGPELQWLGGHGLFVVAPAATESSGGGHDRGDDDNALQTLHGLLSFG